MVVQPRDSGSSPLSGVTRYPTASADHPAHSSGKNLGAGRPCWRRRRPELGRGRPPGDGQEPEEGCCKEAWEEGVAGGLKKTRAWLGGGCGGGSPDREVGRRVDRSLARKRREPGGSEGLDCSQEAEPPGALPANPGQAVCESVLPSLPAWRWHAPSSRRLLPCGVQTWPRYATLFSLQLKKHVLMLVACEDWCL